MVEHFAKRDKVFKVIQTKWQSIERAVDILKIYYLTTKELQRIDFTLSDFYGRLIVIRETLKTYLNTADQLDNLAQYLQIELNTRTPLLMKNPLMICAVFLDRRFSSELTTDEKVLAMRALVKLWEEIRSDNSNNNNRAENNNEMLNTVNSENVLEHYFNSKGVKLTTAVIDNNNEPNYNLTNTEMFENFQNFDEKVGRQPANVNTVDFWEQHKTVYPEIYLLSTIINAVPPTQTKTERCFSELNFVYDEKRSQISLVLLEQILLIRLNKDLVLTIFDEDLGKKNKKVK